MRPRLVAWPFAHMERLAFGLAAGALMLAALYYRAFGLDPRSLWRDDQWVGIVVRHMTLADFFTLRPPAPVGFVVLEKLAAQLSSDPEWPLQLFPLACSLAQIPLIAVLVHRVTGRMSLGLLASALVIIGPVATEVAVRVKQYAADGLATSALLLAGVPLLERWSHRRASMLVMGSTAAVLVSFPSVFVSVALLHVALGLAVCRREHQDSIAPRAFAIVLGFDLALGILYATLLHGQGHGSMKEFWRGYFLPLEVAGATRFIVRHGWAAIQGAVPEALAPALVLAPLGLVDLARQPKRRGLAVSLLAFYAGLVCASALRLYPLGGQRTDSFSHPVAIVLMMSGLRCLTSWPHLGRASAAVTCGLALALVLGFARPSAYPECDDAPVIRVAEDAVLPGDGLVLYPQSALGVGYYAKWPMRVTAWPDYTHGFHVIVERPGTLTLPPRRDYFKRPSLIEPDLVAFLETPRSRIFYFAGDGNRPRVHQMVQRRLREDGYGLQHALRTPTALLLLFAKSSP